MEMRIENFIDTILNRLSPSLYAFSIVFGILLIICGFMLVRHKSSKSKYNIGIASIMLGILGIFSGAIQLFTIIWKLPLIWIYYIEGMIIL